MRASLRLIPLLIAALPLLGCAEGGGSFGSFGSFGGGSGARPKTIAVSDFVFGDGVVAVDRGFTARLEHKVGSFPTFERKTRTNERVNDEIVAAIVASLREAGLDAQPGNEDTLPDAAVVSGRLRPADPVAAKNNQSGFGSGRGGVVADMMVSRSKRQLLAFAAEGSKKASPAPTGKMAAARNAMIAESLVASKAASEKLSPDVEAQARSLGRAIAEKVAGYAKEQGWLNKPEGGETAAVATPAATPAPAPAAASSAKPAAAAEPEQRVRLPDAKPEPKSAQKKKPAKPAEDPNADEPDAPEKPQ
jgi:hypothetical protein